MSKTVIFGKTLVMGTGKVHTNRYVEIHDGKVYRITNFSKSPDITADIIMPGFIDPHVHCRDGNERAKESIRTAGEAAVHGGVTRIHDMPNTVPPVLHESDVEKRLELLRRSETPIEYGLYVGVTDEPSQVREAVGLTKKHPEVMGLKMYAGESVGSIGVTDVNDQLFVYKALAKLSYGGILMVHAEKKSLFSDVEWSVNHPESWCDIRVPEAETEGVRDQAELASKAGFKGRLHICHVSLPETVDIIRKLPRTRNVSCGVTPHHLMLNYDNMLEKTRGLYCKVNPPLRRREEMEGLMRRLSAGRIDWIETDHAPHTLNDKLNSPFMSGMPELDTYGNFIAKLIREFRFPFSDIHRLTSANAAAAFGLGKRIIEEGAPATMTLLDMNPETIARKNMRTNCGWSAYEGMDFPGRCKATIVNGKVAYNGKA